MTSHASRPSHRPRRQAVVGQIHDAEQVRPAPATLKKWHSSWTQSLKPRASQLDGCHLQSWSVAPQSPHWAAHHTHPSRVLLTVSLQEISRKSPHRPTPPPSSTAPRTFTRRDHIRAIAKHKTLMADHHEGSRPSTRSAQSATCRSNARARASVYRTSASQTMAAATTVVVAFLSSSWMSPDWFPARIWAKGWAIGSWTT